MSVKQPPFRSARTTSTITAPIVSFSTNINAKIRRSGRPQTLPVGVRVVRDQVTNPMTLVRVLNDVQTNLLRAGEPDLSNPFRGGIVFRNLSVTNNTPFTLTHNLGRPYVGYVITRSGVGSIWTIMETALPTGLVVTSSIQLTPFVSAGASPGNIDLYVF